MHSTQKIRSGHLCKVEFPVGLISEHRLPIFLPDALQVAIGLNDRELTNFLHQISNAQSFELRFELHTPESNYQLITKWGPSGIEASYGKDEVHDLSATPPGLTPYL